MFGYIAGLSLLVGAALYGAKDPCPAEFRLGQTYHEVQAGPCPSIDSVASFISEDSLHVGYFCRVRQTMAVGNRRTGTMDAFFLFQPE